MIDASVLRTRLPSLLQQLEDVAVHGWHLVQPRALLHGLQLLHLHARTHA